MGVGTTVNVGFYKLMLFNSCVYSLWLSFPAKQGLQGFCYRIKTQKPIKHPV